MQSSDSFLRQLSSKECPKLSSKRWVKSGNSKMQSYNTESVNNNSNNNNNNNNNGKNMMRKRVMVVVDQSSHSKHAMMWALTHVANKGDFFTLLHIQGSNSESINNINNNNFNNNNNQSPDYSLATSLASLCKACKPQVEIEALVVQGPKLATVMSQVKKLDVSVLVLGQSKPSHFLTCLCGRSSTEAFVDKCIENVDCLTIGVRKQSQSIGGYLISTRWQKNFWLLA